MNFKQLSNHKLYKKHIFLSLTFIYIVSIALYSYFEYSNSMKIIEKTISAELIMGAKSVPLLLNKEYHHKGLNKQSISKEQDLINTINLSNFIKTTEIKYIYSFIIDEEGHARFASSSASDEDIANKGSDIYSFDIYEDENIQKAIETQKIIFADSEDKWGSFKSVYIPLKAKDGSDFVVGADCSLTDIEMFHMTAKENILKLAGSLILMIFLYFTIVYIFTKQLNTLLDKKSQELKSIYEVDLKTTLPNRVKLLLDLKQNNDVKLALIDINRFKYINDIYGISFGDKCLEFVGRELFAASGNGMKLYKLDSDKFCLTMPNISHAELKKSVENIIKRVDEKTFEYEDYKTVLSYSVGISSIYSSVNPLSMAEISLKEAKSSGENIVVYDEDFAKEHSIDGKKDVLDDINSAIINEKVYAYFQPIYDIKRKKILKYESLMRIEKRDGTVVAPWYFLAISQQAKLYKKLSSIMLENIISVAKKNRDLEFSINLSSIDIEDFDVQNNLFTRLSEEDLLGQITLEILESEEFKDFNSLVNFEKKAKDMGLKLSIDDFGSGYSNFSTLVEIHFDYVKIDGSLVKDILKNDKYEIIISQIIEFARGLKSKTIAEFVENEEIANKLSDLGVDMLQGYYIGKPEDSLPKES